MLVLVVVVVVLIVVVVSQSVNERNPIRVRRNRVSLSSVIRRVHLRGLFAHTPKSDFIIGVDGGPQLSPRRLERDVEFLVKCSRSDVDKVSLST